MTPALSGFDGHQNHPTIEGPKFYKRHGYYYIFAPGGGVPQGWQVALRSKNVFGPYEDKIVLAQGPTPTNGPHQGAWVDTPDGQEDWFLHFQDQGAYGRVVHLEPMCWQNDWPIIGLDPDGDGTGQPVLTYRKPRVPGSVAVAVPATSDELAGGRPGLQWQWQANPQPQWLAPTPPTGGQLALAAALVPAEAQNLYLAPSLLLQKLPAEHFTATAKLLFTPQAEGAKAGLVVLGMDYATLTPTRQAGGLLLSQTTCRQADKGAAETTAATAALPPRPAAAPARVAVRAGARCQFSYSADGQQFTALGPEFVAREGRWVGAKMGLFCLSVGGGVGPGQLAVDWWRVAP